MRFVFAYHFWPKCSFMVIQFLVVNYSVTLLRIINTYGSVNVIFLHGFNSADAADGRNQMKYYSGKMHACGN